MYLGQLRFAKPEKIAKWDDTLETREQPNACQQTPDTTFGDFAGSAVWNPNTDISEDCLYLNVHAPRNATEVRKTFKMQLFRSINKMSI